MITLKWKKNQLSEVIREFCLINSVTLNISFASLNLNFLISTVESTNMLPSPMRSHIAKYLVSHKVL